MVLELGNLRPAVARLAFFQGLSPWLADAVFPASFLGLPSEHIHVLISSYLDPSGFIFTCTPYLQIQWHSEYWGCNVVIRIVGQHSAAHNTPWFQLFCCSTHQMFHPCVTACFLFPGPHSFKHFLGFWCHRLSQAHFQFSCPICMK